MKQLSSKNRLSISNFAYYFMPSLNIYVVNFFSTKTNRAWGVNLNYLPTVFDSKTHPSPKQKDLITLKKLCKTETTKIIQL